MKDWLSAMEIAAANLPGLPTTKRRVNALAAREGWVGRDRQSRGGGVEYALSILPAEARAAYVARHVAAIDVPPSIANDVPVTAQYSGANEARDARVALLTLADRVAATASIGRKRADRQFCDLYNTAQVGVAEWIKAEVRQITPRTLMRWRAFARDGRTARLAVDRAASRRGCGALDRANGGAVKDFVLALLMKFPQLSAHHIRDQVADCFGGQLVLGTKPAAIPPVRTFQHALKAWRQLYRNDIKRVVDPDGYKSTVRFAARVAHPAARLNQLWQIDASPADALTTDGRHSIYVCIDIFSRRIVALVTKTPRAAAVGLLLRKAILAWGLPEVIKTDNGSDFVARATRSLMINLGIEPDVARPFSPEQKGHVERAIGTMQRDLMATLPGFVGHSVADRKVIEGRKAFAQRLGESAEDAFTVELSPADLQAHLDRWCADIYAQRPHAGLGKRTPFAVAASAAASIRTVDLRALDMLLAPVAGKDGLRTVTKSGIRINDAFYLCGTLDVGDEVFVRMDPADLGRAYVFDREGVAFLGEAICADLAGIDPAAHIAAVRAEQKRIDDEHVAAARIAKRGIKAADLAPAIHREALKRVGGLVEFPRRAETHETPAIAAARAAADSDGLAAVHSAEAVALHQQLQSEPQTVVPLRERETPHQRWNRARAVEDALDRGEQVEPDELLWLGGYREGPEYRGFADTYGVPLRADQQRAADASR